MRIVFPLTRTVLPKAVSFTPANTLCPAMARQKMAPKKIIQKTTAPPSRTNSCKTPQSKQSPLADTFPVQVFESDTGVRGEVIRLSPDGEKSLVVPASGRPLVRSLTQEESDATDLAQKSRATHLVLLPGNPGIVEYYRQVLLMIVCRLPHDVRSSVIVHALGLPGHDLSGLNGSSTFNITAHRDYVLSYLQSDNVKPSLLKGNLILAGHSYGAFLSMEVMDMLSPDVVSRTALFYLMPCLWKMGDCAGLMSRLLLQNPLRITTSSAWLASKLVPAKLLDYLLGTQKYSASVEKTTRRLLSSSSSALYRNIVTLAQDEMRTITALHNYPAIPLVARRTFMLAIENDKWCPPEAVEEIKKAFGPQLTIETPGQGAPEPIEHSFVLSHVQSERVARIVSSWLTELLRSSADKDTEMTEKAR